MSAESTEATTALILQNKAELLERIHQERATLKQTIGQLSARHRPWIAALLKQGEA